MRKGIASLHHYRNKAAIEVRNALMQWPGGFHEGHRVFCLMTIRWFCLAGIPIQASKLLVFDLNEAGHVILFPVGAAEIGIFAGGCEGELPLFLREETF